MKKARTQILKILGGVLALLLILGLGAGFALNTAACQNRIMDYTTDRFIERLGTYVKVDSVSVAFFSNEVRLDGLVVEDLEGRKMFEMDRLEVGIDLMALFSNDIRISKAHITGLRADLYAATPDSPANYQFIIDSLFPPKHPADTLQTAQPEKKPKKKLQFDLKHLLVDHVSLNLHSQKMDTKAVLDQLRYTVEKNQQRFAELSGLQLTTDNHLPRKNEGKPHRGFFDKGHLQLKANLQLSIAHLDKDSIVARLMHAEATDSVTGIDLKDLRFDVVTNLKTAHLKSVGIRLPHTIVSIDTAFLQLPSKKAERPLYYSTSTIEVQTMIKDIARPFAPILQGFTTPLAVSVRLSGDDQSMQFQQIRVNTTDKRLTIAASGGITQLKDPHAMVVSFDVQEMRARDKIQRQIINHFPVKKMMMEQLDRLGNISYTGHFDIFWRKEAFRGLLRTAVGNVDFRFAIDENSKYINGSAGTKQLQLGQLFDVPSVGAIAADAHFKVDISKPRTALMRKQKGGKLPIGHVDAVVHEASYKKIKLHNIHADIDCDGAVAEGKLNMKGRHTDLLCSFSVTQTQSLRKMKFKPGIRFHKLSDEDRAKKQDEKQKKREAKAAEKQRKREEKAARKREKAPKPS